MEISLSLPCYNEEGNIAKVTAEACKILDEITDTPEGTSNYEVIIVNDGSSDKTADIADGLAKDNPKIKVIHHKVNKGYGAAVCSGLKNSRYDYICFADGDGQFDLIEIKRLVELIVDNDIVIGYRIKRNDPLYRLLNAKMYGLLIQILFGLKVRDINCAFKIFKKEVIDDLKIESNGALINAEILIKAKNKGYNKIKEIPVHHYPRVSGKQTGANLKVIIRAFIEIFQLWKKLR